MWLKNPGNFSSAKKFFYTCYTGPYLLGMMCIIINKSQSWYIYPDIKPAPYTLEKQNSFPNLLFCDTTHQSDCNSSCNIFDINYTGESKMQIINSCLLYTSDAAD